MECWIVFNVINKAFVYILQRYCVKLRFFYPNMSSLTISNNFYPNMLSLTISNNFWSRSMTKLKVTPFLIQSSIATFPASPVSPINDFNRSIFGYQQSPPNQSFANTSQVNHNVSVSGPPTQVSRKLTELDFVFWYHWNTLNRNVTGAQHSTDKILGFPVQCWASVVCTQFNRFDVWRDIWESTMSSRMPFS